VLLSAALGRDQDCVSYGAQIAIVE